MTALGRSLEGSRRRLYHDRRQPQPHAVNASEGISGYGGDGEGPSVHMFVLLVDK